MGITWRAVRGDDVVTIMKAAGHKDVSTTMLYVRDAEQVSADFSDVFPPRSRPYFSAPSNRSRTDTASQPAKSKANRGVPSGIRDVGTRTAAAPAA
jgi:hypothetical protein